MTTPPGVGYADITALAKRYAGSGGNLHEAAGELIGETTEEIRQLAISYAPMDTGQLRSSIVSYVDSSGLTGIVTATAPYALFVELGTGVRGEFPTGMITIRPKNAKMLSWIDGNGRRVFAKVVHSPGMKAKPYLRPALEQAIGGLETRLGVAAIMSIVKGPNQ